MTLEDFVQRLEMSAADTGWTSERVEAFLSPRFRGRTDDSVPSLAGKAAGLRLGCFPVLASVIELEDVARMQSDLKRLHGQMVIARSFMRPEEIINAHILLCARETSSQHDWRKVIDVAERDETVCRKLVWNWGSGTLDASYDRFIDRSFLAKPWADSQARPGATLDRTDSLSLRILQEEGLSATVAASWVRIAGTKIDDPEIRVNQFVNALEAGR